jgi:hypothetical protein
MQITGNPAVGQAFIDRKLKAKNVLLLRKMNGPNLMFQCKTLGVEMGEM